MTFPSSTRQPTPAPLRLRDAASRASWFFLVPVVLALPAILTTADRLRDPLLWTAAVCFVLALLTILRGAVVVDAEGVHRDGLVRRTTIVPWDDVEDVILRRVDSRSQKGELVALRSGGKRPLVLPVTRPDWQSKAVGYWHALAERV